MFDRFRSQHQYPIEFALLACLAVSLPMFRAPTIILWVGYVAVWLINRWDGRARSGAWGGRWDGWDTLIVAWIATTAAGATFAGLHHHEWRACNGILRMTTIVWLLKRSGYGDAEWVTLHVAVQLGAAAASMWALVALALPHDYLGIQLNSAGDTNTSAIYIVICFGALVGAVIAYWETISWPLRAAAAIAVVILLASLFASGSRAGVATAIISAILLGLVSLKRSRRPMAWIAAGIAIFGISLAAFDTDMHRKQQLALQSESPVLNERYPLWREALVAWRTYPLFGIGADNFEEVTELRVRAWTSARGEKYDAVFFPGSHAHSLYLNTLAERGLAGVVLLAALLVMWAWSLLQSLPTSRDSPARWLVWSGAGSALVAVSGIGIFNTTLHDEHGVLAMLLLGAWLGRLRGEGCLP